MLTKVGKYKIKSELGKGAMGVVYLGEDERLARPVALKVMSSAIAGDQELLKRFYREAQSAGQLRHPNIVTIYDIDEEGGSPFIAMEYLEGESLDKIIAQRRDLSLDKKLDIAIQASKGLHYAHEHGIVHRDVKPANIVVLKDGLVKIVDFGIAHVGGDSLTRTGTVLGTPAYMSPEQVLGKPVDACSDIYSLGIILYELLSFENPVKASDITTVFYRIVNEPLPPITKFIPDLPPQVQKVVMKAAAKDPSARYLTAGDLAFELQQVGSQIRRVMVTGYIQRGEKCLEQGQFVQAKESLQRALEIDSSYDVARELLVKVQAEIQARQKRERIDELLGQVKAAFATAAYDDVVTIAGEILRLDEKHEEAQRYTKMAVEQRERGQKIKLHLEQAQKLVVAGDLKIAKSELEAALAIDAQHAGALNMLAGVEKSLTEQERARQIHLLVENARTHLAEKRFEDALGVCEKAKGIDPGNLEVESLFRLVRSSKTKYERRKLLDEKLAAIQEALSLERFEDAQRLVEEGLKQFPNESDLLRLQTQSSYLAEARREHQYVDEQIQAARGFLDRNEFSPAVDVLEKALAKVPHDTRLASYLKGVQDAKDRADVEKVRQEALRQANSLIHNKDFAGAVSVLEKALARAGQSSELVDFLQFVREQEAENRRRQQIQKALAEAQRLVREDKYKQAVGLLESSQSELRAPEIAAMLASVQAQGQKFEEKRKAACVRALELLKQDNPRDAVGLLDNSPESYFQDDEFQRVYAQCRETSARADAIRGIVQQAEQLMQRGEFEPTRSFLGQALSTYPSDAALTAMLKRVDLEESKARRAVLVKLLDEVKVQMGRMLFAEAINRLSSVDWNASGFPDLATSAARFRAEAEKRLKEREEAASKTILLPQSPRPNDATVLLQGVPPEAAGPKSPSAQEENATRRMPAPPAAGAATSETVALPGLTKNRAAAATTTQKPSPVTPPTAAPQPQAPVLPRPATPARIQPQPAPVAARAKAPTVWLVLLGAVLVIAVAAFMAWRHFAGGAALPGYVQLTSAPWAQVTSIQTADGRNLNLTGQTPLRLELPPGKYEVQLENNQTAEKVEVEVKAGEVSTVNYVFPGANVKGMVDDLVSSK